MSDDIPGPFYLMPDDADRRELLELESHRADLGDAGFALESALERGISDGLWMPLTMYAATAYIRPFIHSNVRTRLDQRPDFPGMLEEHHRLHETIRTYRNTTVAHSQSDLATPLAVAMLDEAGDLKDVLHYTILQPMPTVVAVGFADLIELLELQVATMSLPFRSRLRDRWKGTSSRVMSQWDQMQVLHSSDCNFDAKHRRSHLPTFRPFWDITEIGRSAGDDS